MPERGAVEQPTRRIKTDGAYSGGERLNGECGQEAPGKEPFAAPVETMRDGRPVRPKLNRVVNSCNALLSSFARISLDPARAVIGDRLKGSADATDAGCVCRPVKTAPDSAAARTPAFNWWDMHATPVIHQRAVGLEGLESGNW